MHMEVTSKSLENAIVVYIDGDLTTNSSPKVATEINDIVKETSKNVIINIERVNFIASTGLRIILKIGKGLDKKGVKLSVCSMNSSTKSVFEMSGFSKIFPIYDNEEDAIATLSKK